MNYKYYNEYAYFCNFYFISRYIIDLQLQRFKWSKDEMSEQSCGSIYITHNAFTIKIISSLLFIKN